MMIFVLSLVPTITYPSSIGATTTFRGQNNRCANVQAVYPMPTTFTTDADVWYKFTTPNTAAPHAVEVTVISGLPFHLEMRWIRKLHYINQMVRVVLVLL
ncbi:MAG: hypothetical protein IPF63_10355 [Bacteroidetes bacterium]|nr:hypothetical protein [Bacteroidota bacterium]